MKERGEKMRVVIDKLVSHGLSKEAESIEVIAERQAALRFKLPVMGGMKSGKSTLLARLLGVDDSYFPKDTIEATAKNINVSYGPFPLRTYTTPDGIENSVADSEIWNKMVCGQSDIDFTRLDVTLPDSLLADNSITFVDTPGNNTSDDYKVTETWNALVDSQTGIYCLKATALIENSDLTFIQEAKYYMNEFIFVITRIDEVGGKSVHSDIAKHLVDTAQKRLAELQISPLAILPISSLAPALQDTGIPELKAAIQNTIHQHGDKLKNHQIYQQSVRILEKTQDRVGNELQVAKKAIGTTASQFAEQRGALEGKLIELNSEKQNATRRLKGKVEALELQSYKAISQISDVVMERLEGRLDAVASFQEIEETGNSITRSEIDKWRQEVQKYLVQLPSKVSSLQVEVSQDFVEQLRESISA
ncbi:MAG: hypothetical protein GX927_02080, partial [Lentisphaerae bacterium]|nr:hypothetical protein [Lentisphaerota bacterium]